MRSAISDPFPTNTDEVNTWPSAVHEPPALPPHFANSRFFPVIGLFPG
jgi:hypothetical protein